MIQPYSDRIHPAPFLKVFASYKKSDLRGDMLAGLTVAVFAIPQAIAFGILAEVNPIHGLYSAMVASIVAALWGSAIYVNTGPTNSASMLTAAALLSYQASDNYMQVVFLFTLMVGILRLTMGLLKMGSLIHFVPESAFLGFTMAIGSMIALGRLHHLLGIENAPTRWFPASTFDKLTRIGEADPHTVVVSLMSIAVMVGFSKYAKRLPVALLAIVVGLIYAQIIPGNHVMLVQDISPVPSGLPAPVSPFFAGWTAKVGELAPAAFAVALVGLIEAVSIGQTLAVRHRMHLNFNQEFFGQGLGMIVSSFFQGIPGSGSFGRSFLMEQSGSKTLVANVIFGIATGVFLLVLPGMINLIPLASLAGLLLYIGLKLIDPVRIKRLWRTSTLDTVVMLATFSVTIFWRIEYGIFTGMVIAAMMHLQKSRQLHLDELLPAPDGTLDERPYTPGSLHEPSSIVVLTTHGDLGYGVAHELLEQLNEIVQTQNPEIIVMRTRRVFSIDFSCWNAIFDFAEGFQQSGGKLLLSGIDEKTAKTIHDAKAGKWIPDDQLFLSTENIMESTRQALRKAEAEVKHPENILPAWRDWFENPTVITSEEIRDIQKFLQGEV
jgi:SulP family sulfate permease